MRNQQRGMTTIGLILVVAVLGLIFFAGIQLIPAYLENMKVVQVLNQTQQTLSGQNATKVDILNSLEKRMSLEDLDNFKVRKDFVVKRTAGGLSVGVEYERRAPYVANIYLLTVFEHTVEIAR